VAKKRSLRYFLKLAYHGKAYHGWQIQPNAFTVQEHINTQLSTLLRKEINIVGAGRTDTGVHAKEMYAHFDFASKIKDTESVVKRLNKMLSPHTVVYDLIPVAEHAHARFDAEERSYRYYINRQRNPFQHHLAANIFYPLDFDLMQQATEVLCFKGDFSSFCKSRTQTKTNICEIREAFWEQYDGQWVFQISADRFLRNMVRAIVGSLLEVGKGKMSLLDFKTMIKAQDRRLAGESVPAQGLYLTRVKYPTEIFLHV